MGDGHLLVTYLERYINQRGSLKDLQDCLLSYLQEILNSKDTNAIHFANEIDADLIEFNESLIDEATLRERFSACMRRQQTYHNSFPNKVEPSQNHLQIGCQDATLTNNIEIPGLVQTIKLVVFA